MDEGTTFDMSREETQTIAYEYTRTSSHSGMPPNPGNIIRLGEICGRRFAVLRGAYLLSPLVISCLILGINGTYLYYFGSILNKLFLALILLAGSCLFFAVVLVATLDPGYVSRHSPEILDVEDSKIHHQFTCLKCFTTAEDKVYHDSFCDLCVLGYDHFCIVLGNVIGKNNIIFFYSIFIFYVVNVVSLVFGIVSTQS